MSLYTLIIVAFVIFMAINVIIGLRGRKHASTTKDFLTASGQSGIWFIIASAVGASIGSGVVIGTTQYAVKLGVAGAWYAIACGLACVVHAFVMTRFIYRNKLVSFSDYFKRRYDSNFIVLLYSGIGPFACAASMGGQLVAAKAIFQAFGIDSTIGLVITAAVMLVYTMFAGLWGSYATAVFQVGVIIVGVLVVGISMFTQGGIAEIHAFYPAEKFDLFNISPELWMMFVGPMVLSVLVDQTSVQRAASAKTEATAFWGHLLSCIPLFLFGWLMVYIGMWSGAEFPDAGGNAFIVMLMNKVSPIVCAVMICAILAAIMSTASGALVATDALVVHDLYCGFINKNATEEQQKRLNLIVNIVVSVAAVVCALAFTNVIDLLSVGYTIMLSGTLVPLLGGIIWKRGTTKGAAASAAVGMITALLSIFGVIIVICGDANQAWPVGVAVNTINRMEPYGMGWIEQPTIRYNLKSLSDVKHRTAVPILGHEVNWTMYELINVLRENCVDCVKLDGRFDAGYTGVRISAGMAEAAGIPCVHHSFFQLGISLAGSLHVMASCPNFTLASSWGEYGKMIDDVIIGGPLKMKTVPYLEIPTAPGIGVELDRDKLALYHSFYQKEIYEKGYERETERPYYTAMFMRPYFKDILD